MSSQNRAKNQKTKQKKNTEIKIKCVGGGGGIFSICSV